MDRKKRVLIVDNSERVLWTLQADLENAGFDTSTTWSGREALQLLGAGDFDVLLVDDYLPDLHADDFLKRVGKLPMQPWIVVMQVKTNNTNGRRYDSLGAAVVVDKRRPDEIREAVSSCCEGSHSLRRSTRLCQ